jgi:chromate transport protein ChrA
MLAHNSLNQSVFVEKSPLHSLTRAYNPRMAYSKPILAGLCASAITYLCFLTWFHIKATSAARERGTTGLIAVAGGATYVLHSPAFWALAIIAFGVAFFLFREA